VVELPCAADSCPCVEKLRTVLPLTVVSPGSGWHSGEAPARQTLITRGLIPVLAEGSTRATDSDTTDEILSSAVEHAKLQGLCAVV
jgi:pyruvate kinase